MNSKWTIARRVVQLAVIALIASPRAAQTVFQGNLSSGALLGIGLSDPLAFLQATVASRLFIPSFFGSAVIIAVLYFLTGGRSFCGWVCPVYLVTEIGDKLGSRIGTCRKHYPLATNRWVLAATLVLALVTAVPIFEIISPIGVLARAVMFGAYAPLLLVGAIVVVEVAVSRRIWCRSLCPVGGFYALLGRFSPLRVAFTQELCTKCGECSRVCPVEEVLEAPLVTGAGQVASGDCTRCGACIDACQPRALRMGIGYKN